MYTFKSNQMVKKSKEQYNIDYIMYMYKQLVQRDLCRFKKWLYNSADVCIYLIVTA